MLSLSHQSFLFILSRFVLGSYGDSCNFAQMPTLDLMLTVDECSNIVYGQIPISVSPVCIYEDDSNIGYAETKVYLGSDCSDDILVIANITVTGSYKCCKDCPSNCQSYGFHFSDYYDNDYPGLSDFYETYLGIDNFNLTNKYSVNCSWEYPEVTNFTLYMDDRVTGITDNATCIDYYFNGTNYTVSRRFYEDAFVMNYYQGTNCTSKEEQGGTVVPRCNSTADPYIITWSEGCGELVDLTCITKRARNTLIYPQSTTTTTTISTTMGNGSITYETTSNDTESQSESEESDLATCIQVSNMLYLVLLAMIFVAAV